MVAACPFPCPRGTPTRILRLAEALGRRGHEVHVVTYHIGEPVSGPFQVHRIGDVPGYRRTAPGPSARKLVQLDPALGVLLRDVLKRQAIELIHAHHYEGLLCARWARRRGAVPLIYDAHTLLDSELPFYFPRGARGVARAAGRLLDGWLPPWADEVVTVSAGIRAALLHRTRLLPEQITVVPNGVEDAWYGPAARAPANGAAGQRTLIFTGNLAPYQGIDLLLRSFRLVLDRLSNVKLRIVTGSSFAPYEELARELGVREYVELVPDDVEHTAEYLAAADVALNPRVVCAGTPQKLLNYMAAGTPIVSFKGSAAMLEHGHTAWLAVDADETSFADGALRCLDDPALAMAMATEARHLARLHSWEAAAVTLETIYERLAGRCT